MNIHKAIKIIRCQRGLSQEELGKAIGNDASQIAKIESGDRTPGLRTLERICSTLDLPLLTLIFLAMEPAELWSLDDSILQAMNENYKEFVEAKWNQLD